MSIYKTLLEKAEKGKRCKIDLNNKDLWIGRKRYIEGGELCVDDDLITSEDFKEFNLDEDVWVAIKELYLEFKYSIPNENYSNHSYFKPLPYSDLTDGDLAYGKPRYYAQVALEGFILLAVLKKLIEWPYENKWFFQYEEENELILLKQWF